MRRVYLNFNPAAPTDLLFSAAIGSTVLGIVYNPNGETLNPFAFTLDLCVAGGVGGNGDCNGDIPGTEPFSIAISAKDSSGSAYALNAALFNYPTPSKSFPDGTEQSLYAAAHLQGCTSTQTGCDGTSIKVGALSSSTSSTSSTGGGGGSGGGNVPEPGSITLLGAGGMIGGLLAAYRRRRNRVSVAA